MVKSGRIKPPEPTLWFILLIIIGIIAISISGIYMLVRQEFPIWVWIVLSIGIVLLVIGVFGFGAERSATVRYLNTFPHNDSNELISYRDDPNLYDMKRKNDQLYDSMYYPKYGMFPLNVASNSDLISQYQDIWRSGTSMLNDEKSPTMKIVSNILPSTSTNNGGISLPYRMEYQLNSSTSEIPYNIKNSGISCKINDNNKYNYIPSTKYLNL